MRLTDKIRLALTFRRVLNQLPDLDVMKEKLASRKLWAAVLGAALVTLGDNLGLKPDLVQSLVTIVVGYIAGQGVVDAANALRK